MATSRNTLPAPVLFPGDEPFWDAAREGRLMGKHCPACDRVHYYPRIHCPFCGHGQTSWRELSGRGRVYSHSIVERSPRPTAPAIIELEEGIRLSSVVVDADVHALAIGDAVTLRFLPTQDGPPVPNHEIIAHGFFAPDALPEGTTRATRARIAEVFGGVAVSELW